MKRMDHILEQALRMVEGKETNFIRILNYENVPNVKTITLGKKITDYNLNQTISQLTSSHSPENSNYLLRNQFNNTNEKELFEWT